MSREIDKQIAEKVFGYRFSYYVDTEDGSYDVFHEAGSNITFKLPKYSTDIKAACEVIAEMERKGYVWTMIKRDTIDFVFIKAKIIGQAEDKKASMAIGLAALKALEE